MSTKLSNDEAATYLNVHPSTLATWRSKDISPPYYKYPTGGKVFYFKGDLDKWMESERNDTTAN